MASSVFFVLIHFLPLGLAQTVGPLSCGTCVLLSDWITTSSGWQCLCSPGLPYLASIPRACSFPEENGAMSITTTMQETNEKILSLHHCDLSAEILTVDAQILSLGVLLVTGKILLLSRRIIFLNKQVICQRTLTGWKCIILLRRYQIRLKKRKLQFLRCLIQFLMIDRWWPNLTLKWKKCQRSHMPLLLRFSRRMLLLFQLQLLLLGNPFPRAKSRQ